MRTRNFVVIVSSLLLLTLCGATVIGEILIQRDVKRKMRMERVKFQLLMDEIAPIHTVYEWENRLKTKDKSQIARSKKIEINGEYLILMTRNINTIEEYYSVPTMSVKMVVINNVPTKIFEVFNEYPLPGKPNIYDKMLRGLGFDEL